MENDSLATKYPMWTELLEQKPFESAATSSESSIDHLIRFVSLLNEIEQESIASYSNCNEDQRNQH